jgi:hypothetical protein
VNPSAQIDEEIIFHFETVSGGPNRFLRDLLQEISANFPSQPHLVPTLFHVDCVQFGERAVVEQFFRLGNNILMAGTNHDTIPFADPFADTSLAKRSPAHRVSLAKRPPAHNVNLIDRILTCQACGKKPYNPQRRYACIKLMAEPKRPSEKQVLPVSG